ncbi:hypothetical protein FKW77_004250 [Venturia effusa]|uniref:Uncharacterized protein n=1 Tax=Venturia effusa TaxID=50376 RepID=A0A517LH01_9PEZI|nr:hypothetical protein FKW77_004250 [Venturia effusa]
MAPTDPPAKTVIDLPKNFLSLPRELRQDILMASADSPSQDLFPETGVYHEGRNRQWYDAFHSGIDKIRTWSAMLEQITSNSRLAVDIEYVQTRLIESWRRLEDAWLWTALDEGPERWKDAEEWIDCDAHHAQATRTDNVNNGSGTRTSDRSVVPTIATTSTQTPIHSVDGTTTTPTDNMNACNSGTENREKTPPPSQTTFDASKANAKDGNVNRGNVGLVLPESTDDGM